MNQITDQVPTREDAAKFMTNAAEARRRLRASLPDWRRHFADLLDCVPEKHRLEAAASASLLLSALVARTLTDPLKLAKEANAAHAEEVEFIHSLAPTG
jgi:hypothetical protein